MQSTEKNSVDTRTFPEIFDSLDQYWRTELKVKMMLRMRISEVTFYNWAKGASRPRNFSAQKDVAVILKSVLKVNAHPGYLFPYQRATNNTTI